MLSKIDMERYEYDPERELKSLKKEINELLDEAIQIAKELDD